MRRPTRFGNTSKVGHGDERGSSKAKAVRLFLDECLSPRLVAPLYALGAEVVIHPRDHGGLGRRDDQVLARCLRDDLVIVTENATDFRKLVGGEEMHPGLIVLPCATREQSLILLSRVLATLGEDPMGFMVNKVVEVSASGEVAVFDIPTRGP